MPASGKILVANIGSTSFKFRLFDMPAERLLASGGADRIGQSDSAWSFRCGTWLPGAKLLVQAGPQLMVIDAPSGRAALLGRGQGPLAVLEGPQP